MDKVTRYLVVTASIHSPMGENFRHHTMSESNFETALDGLLRIKSIMEHSDYEGEDQVRRELTETLRYLDIRYPRVVASINRETHDATLYLHLSADRPSLRIFLGFRDAYRNEVGYRSLYVTDQDVAIIIDTWGDVSIDLGPSVVVDPFEEAVRLEPEEVEATEDGTGATIHLPGMGTLIWDDDGFRPE